MSKRTYFRILTIFISLAVPGISADATQAASTALKNNLGFGVALGLSTNVTGKGRTRETLLARARGALPERAPRARR